MDLLFRCAIRVDEGMGLVWRGYRNNYSCVCCARSEEGRPWSVRDTCMTLPRWSVPQTVIFYFLLLLFLYFAVACDSGAEPRVERSRETRLLLRAVDATMARSDSPALSVCPVTKQKEILVVDVFEGLIREGRDPWGQVIRIELSDGCRVQYAVSCGPDAKCGTDDDFKSRVRQSNQLTMVELKCVTSYWSVHEQLYGQSSIVDCWGNVIRVNTDENTHQVKAWSSGEDGVFGTGDDLREVGSVSLP